MRDDVSDPRLSNVRIMAVVLSVDYRHARVHFTLAAGIEERRSAECAFLRVTPFLRARLADGIELKRVPDLRFVFDGVALSNDGEPSCFE